MTKPATTHPVAIRITSHGFAFNVNRGNQWIARVIVTEAKEHQSVARLDLKRAEPELTPQKGDSVRRAD